MNGSDFYRTVMGQRFYNVTLPELVKQLTRIADTLERLAPPPPGDDDEDSSLIVED